jgi:hypothetical protein
VAKDDRREQKRQEASHVRPDAQPDQKLAAGAAQPVAACRNRGDLASEPHRKRLAALGLDERRIVREALAEPEFV